MTLTYHIIVVSSFHCKNRTTERIDKPYFEISFSMSIFAIFVMVDEELQHHEEFCNAKEKM